MQCSFEIGNSRPRCELSLTIQPPTLRSGKLVDEILSGLLPIVAQLDGDRSGTRNLPTFDNSLFRRFQKKRRPDRIHDRAAFQQHFAESRQHSA
jgi:hypothetical protein